jgi:hypothetical protein
MLYHSYYYMFLLVLCHHPASCCQRILHSLCPIISFFAVDLRHLRRQAKKARKRANLKARKHNVLAEKARELDELDQLITDVKVQFGELPRSETEHQKIVPHGKHVHLFPHTCLLLDVCTHFMPCLGRFFITPVPHFCHFAVALRRKAKKARKRANRKDRKQDLLAEKARNDALSQPSSPRISASTAGCPLPPRLAEILALRNGM